MIYNNIHYVFFKTDKYRLTHDIVVKEKLKKSENVQLQIRYFFEKIPPLPFSW